MWRFSLLVGLLLGIVVGVVGYGRVLPSYLAVRVLLVVLGTALTIVGASKVVNVLIGEQSTGTTSPQVKEVDLGSLDEGGEGEEPEESATVMDEDSPDASDEETDASDIEDEAEIEELADMVSETMKDEENES